jgi:CheY-like chemotaxis protein
MARGDGEMILVVDDNATNLKLAATVLECDGYEVCTATDGASALAALRQHHPELAFVDVKLPDIDGLELAERIKAEPDTSHVVVVALTACAMQADRERALAAGCAGFIAKPFDTRELGDQVARHLNGRRVRESR